jgi:hypothetical protein
MDRQLTLCCLRVGDFLPFGLVAGPKHLYALRSAGTRHCSVQTRFSAFTAGYAWMASAGDDTFRMLVQG